MTSSVPALTFHPALKSFLEDEVLPDLGIDAAAYLAGCAQIVADLTPRNRALLDQRKALQTKIDAYHAKQSASGLDAGHYRAFLSDIGYLAPAVESFAIDTQNVDAEIAATAGPQLVVPVSNARFALNAANARWGSLYDAIYGTDAIDEQDGRERAGAYNPVRGAAVVAAANTFLDTHFALAAGHYADVARFHADTHTLPATLKITLADGSATSLVDIDQFAGFSEREGRLTLLLKNNGLHVELCIDAEHPIGKTSASGLCDVVMESALTTIADCEDSVAAVDAEDKVGVYRNWLGLMRGTLDTSFSKGGDTVHRRLHADRVYNDLRGGTLTLPGRSLLLVRNVGHLMTTDAMLDANGNEVFEGIVDAIVTVTCALYDLRHSSTLGNSRAGSVYIVKPKMHGPDEAAFANELFDRVEDLLTLDRHTVKIGVMDEERRTTLNLSQCIHAVRHRLVFINTGFLDRTGDEIHTSMESGAMPPKETIKAQRWINAYEDWNVDIGIACGLPGRAQIGKGMWPKPDEMRQMLDAKAGHPMAGANCAWVPSPTAATLHAMHYHEVDVGARQQELANRQPIALDELLLMPSLGFRNLSDGEIQAELDNNAQGILGYVVRWIDQGVGCSKVPDIHNVGLMEDRATLRISSQLLANWLRHNVCTREDIEETFERMARVVDVQNQNDPAYVKMAPDFASSLAYRAACDLVFKGAAQPSGYTEPLLHDYRRQRKAELA
ncbi:MAG: malate synthase G [Gammaproteobacteria bacterium]